ncbi:nitrilase-related carbon-nitrogen hydrolase [Pseudonocardia humida]|uniref:Amidohydrolase n=1 Tax=Pseudonocardia humida TaxID=2800819 RepID=A0ABT1AEF8_9PSEU|nr:nitrilase-related carbon-nitrogen hydrolase [Pseudonocardia humida]MCO1661099.1 amidohydrolase [Pseudonocardia humida]
MRIALAQTDAVLGDIDANVERAEQMIDDATAQGAEVVVFPELSLSGFSVGEVDDDVSMELDDKRLVSLAERTDAGVLLGFPEAQTHGLHTYNSSAYFADRKLVHVHRKLYLPNYSIFEERKHFLPGQTSRAYPVGNGRHRAATLICNDAWQPQLAFLSVQDGAHILLVPAASGQSSFPEHYNAREYWEGITRFYGRMYQLFVVFVNRVGTEGQLRFWGGSHVIDPWGEMVGECAESSEDLLVVDIDLAEVRRRRRGIPLVREARLGMLRREIDRLLDEGGDL